MSISLTRPFLRGRLRARATRDGHAAGTLVREVLAVLSLACTGAPGVLPVHAQIAVRGDVVHTMEGEAIGNGVVLLRDGRIEAVGPASAVRIPDGFRVIEGAVVTPGLIDAHSVAGLSGRYNYWHEQDQLDKSDPIQPELRAIDAYNPREELITWLRGFGITTLHTGHGPGAIVSGQTMIVKTRGETLREALVDSVAMFAVTLGPSVARTFDGKPGTRSRGAAMLRQALIEAREYRTRHAQSDTAAPAIDLRKEAFVRLLEGEIPALVTAQHATEIMTALRLADEFGIRIILDGASESYLLLDEIREAGIPVIIHPPLSRATGEQVNMTFETPLLLRRAGIPFALQSGFEAYVPKTRVVLFEAAVAAAYGLAFDEALASITIDAARILGIDDRVGSLRVGKDGDVVVFDGDPFEYASHVCAVLIEGELFSETCR